MAAVDPQFLPTILSSTEPAPNGYFGQSVALTPTYAVVGAPDESAYGISGAGAAYIVNLSSGASVRLVSPNPENGGYFGYSVAAFGNFVLVGAPSESVNGATGAGNAYLFNAAGGYLQTLTSPNAQTFGEFGISVAVAGNYAVVGAAGETISGYTTCGDAYLINLLSDAYRLLISSYPEDYVNFGTSVSISSTFVAVGAPYDSSGGTTAEGAVYVFAIPTGNLVERILNPTPSSSAFFGFSVAVNGTTVVGGAPQGYSPPISNAGVVYAINMRTNGITTIYSPSPIAGGYFGGAVAVNSETIVTGAEQETSGGQLRAGNAYLFSVQTGNLVSSTFSAPGWPFNGRFGISVAESGSTVIVGANSENASGVFEAGHAFVFNQIPLTVLSPGSHSNGHFGESVAIYRGVMVVGAPDEPADVYVAGGEAYIVRIGPSPQLSIVTLSTPNPTGDGMFGTSVSVAGDTVVVGAPGETAGGQPGAGNVYIFSLSTGMLLRTLSSPSPQPGGGFGDAVATDGSLVIVGAPFESFGNASQGAAYVFNATTGALAQTLSTPNPVDNGYFGSAVALKAGTALVGAAGETAHGLANAGNAYLFSASTGVLVAPLTSPNPVGGGAFGYAVALGGGLAVVGAPGEYSSGVLGAGEVYVFSPTSGAFREELVTTTPVSDGYFGCAVATNGNTIVVGAYGEPSVGMSGAGAIYLYHAYSGSVFDRFYSPLAAAGGNFGGAVGFADGRVVAGAPGESDSPRSESESGHAYVFGLSDSPIYS
ncbi:MAG TPA: hypothetical protein VMH38_08270 [Thermoplasmata archaeon]|nr:hypothetical protein [Thermoplasmata archaeon]